jgi:hypothetical protein
MSASWVLARSGAAMRIVSKALSGKIVRLIIMGTSIQTRAGYYQGVSERVNRVAREVFSRATKRGCRWASLLIIELDY